MNVRIWFMLLFAVLSIPLPANAKVTSQAHIKCLEEIIRRQGSERAPPSLTAYAKVEIVPQELKTAGYYLGPESRLPESLDDGVYVWIANERGDIFYSPRAPDLTVDIHAPQAKYLASHRSLMAQAREKSGEFDVRAAGEFRISSGRVSEVNNQSGTFRGKRDSLTYGARLLEQKGLKIELKTHLADHSGDKALLDKVHGKAVECAYAQIKYLKSAELEEATQLYRKLVAKYPVASRPGRLDFNQITHLLEAIERSLSKPALELSNDELESLQNLYNAQFLSKTMDQDGVPFALLRLDQSGQMSQLKTVLAILEGFLK